MTKELPYIEKIENAHALCFFGDSITTDHISPASYISKISCAARFLLKKGIPIKDFNSYGMRRGNDEIMARGTFANIRLINKIMDRPGAQTIHFPSGETLDIFEAAMRYKAENIPTIILAGHEYGSGSSRDWAAKGPYLLGVRVVIAASFERIHRSNLLGMGILPLQFRHGETAESHGLTGTEIFSIQMPEHLAVRAEAVVTTNNGKSFNVRIRLDTEPEISYYLNGGILHYVLRKLMNL